jgi:serine/threonine protein kinase
MEWRLLYRAKGASAAIYLGTPLSPSHPVAVKVALDGDRPIDSELVREAEMMQQVASSHPEAVCRLYHQPAAGDAEPVFLAMTKVDCDFEQLCRLRKPSPSSLCEGLLLTFYALRSVHQSGVLHRDVELNKVGFRICDAVRHPRSSSSSSPVLVRADGVHGVVDSRVSACMLDFGEAVPLRIGHQGPTDYGAVVPMAALAMDDTQHLSSISALGAAAAMGDVPSSTSSSVAVGESTSELIEQDHDVIVRVAVSHSIVKH